MAEELTPPTDKSALMAHFLTNKNGATVSALWLPNDRVWMIHGAFLDCELAAECGYHYEGSVSYA